MRSAYLLPLVILGASGACGDNDHPNTPVDAQKQADAMIDAKPPIACTYTEAADATNDPLFNAGTAEMSSISLTTTPVAICGKFDSTHFESTPGRVDVDAYRITVPAMSNGIVYLQAPGGENFDGLFVEIRSATSFNVDEIAKFTGNLAVTTAKLEPGDYFIFVTANDSVSLTAPVDYKVIVALESTARCATSTAAVTYTESGDGATADGNDMVEVRYGAATPKRKFTDSTTVDAPEATGISVAPGASYHVTGTSIVPGVTPMSWADSFQDRDTYQVAMGANASILSVRLNWPGTTADFDVFVFPMNQFTDQAQGWYNRKVEDEFVTTAVLPGMSYWIWVGADDSSTGQPINYDLTICGYSFEPF